MDEQSIGYDKSLLITLEQARTTFGENQDSKQQSLPLCSDTNGLEEYLKQDNQICDDLNNSLLKLREQLPFLESKHDNHANELSGKDDIENLVAQYIRNELLHIKTEARRKGLESRIQSLEKDMRKLKGLPQVIPILKSSIEGFENNIKKETQEQKEIQHNDIEPLLSKIADTTIRAPLLTVKTADDHEALQQYLSQLDTILNTLNQQRAVQKLINYAYQVDNYHQQQHASVLETLVDEISKQCSDYKTLEISVIKDRQKPSVSSDAQFKDDDAIAQIENMLNQAKLDSLPGLRRRSFQGSSMLTKVNAILEYEKKWTEQWSNNFNSILDAAYTLDETKEGLMDSLYEHAHTRDNLIMMPSPYIDLQSDLELRTQEIEDTLADLENGTKKDASFAWKKKLFTAFFTDPNAFEELLQSSSQSSSEPSSSQPS
ncbi:hypothetical protein BDC45DRAFT_50541 [Circinella umbellata]|nr:hypothetical protein BDC45DRAFT_50541 [Circinella umbellata]